MLNGSGGARAGAAQRAYTYGASAHPHAVTSVGGGAGATGYSAAYDAAGHMTCRALGSSASCTNPTPTGQSLTYDQLGQMLTRQSADGAASGQYADDGEGDRVWQRATSTSGGGTTTTTTTVTYILGVEEVTSVAISGGTTTATATRYYALPGGRTALRDAGGLSYLATDLLGTPILTYHLDTGAVLGGQLRTPYGQARYADSASTNGGMHTTFGFTGQREDSAGAGIAGGSGLDDFHARSYDPAVGRFTSADTVAWSDPLGDAYGYVGGMVEVATDPSGNLACADCMEGGQGYVAGATVAGGPDGAGTGSGSPQLFVDFAKWLDPILGTVQMYRDVRVLQDPRASRGDKLRAAGNLFANSVMDLFLAKDSAFFLLRLGEDGLIESGRAGEEIHPTPDEPHLGAGGLDGDLHFGDGGEGTPHEPTPTDPTPAKPTGPDGQPGGGSGGGSGGGVGGCSFSADTPVATPAGEQPIGDLQVGDAVLAYDPQTGQSEPQTVQHVWVNHDTDLVDVRLASAPSDTSPSPSSPTSDDQHQTQDRADSGDSTYAAMPSRHKGSDTQADHLSAATVHTTANHPWLTADRGWIPASNLRAGEAVVTLEGGISTVVWVRVVAGQADMYNLTVSRDHTYAVGNGQAVVHNECPTSLPEFKPGGKTTGAFYPSGTDGLTMLESGYRGPSADMPPNTPGISNMTVRSHVEAHAASLMRLNGIQDADLWINNPAGPCGKEWGCNNMLPHMLPEGATLRVHFPDGAGGWVIREYTGLSDTLWDLARPGQ